MKDIQREYVGLVRADKRLKQEKMSDIFNGISGEKNLKKKNYG